MRSLRTGVEYKLTIRAASGALPEEATYFLKKVEAICILASDGLMERGKIFCSHIHGQEHSESLALLPISHCAEPVQSTDINIDETSQIEPDGPGLVLFTSGTTGLPKGVVLPRRCFSCEERAEPGITSISYRPGHWIAGARNLIRPMLMGHELYALEEATGNTRAEIVWQALAKYRPTFAEFSPEILRHMMDVVIDQTKHLSQHEKEALSNHFEGLSTIRSSASIPDPAVVKFWTDLSGLPFEVTYASTEL